MLSQASVGTNTSDLLMADQAAGYLMALFESDKSDAEDASSMTTMTVVRGGGEEVEFRLVVLLQCAVCRSVDRSIHPSQVHIGVCFVDCATGTFHCGAFGDDAARSRLDGLLAQVGTPEDVLLSCWCCVCCDF
jgi:DNA mismatch repair ATPase MutS